MNYIINKLEKIKGKRLYRELRYIDTAQSPRVKINLIDYLKNCARSFIYSTALSPATIAVSIKALEIIENDVERRVNLLKMSDWF